MDGSQLPTEWTHLNRKLATGVNDSRKRDVSKSKTGIPKNEDSSTLSKSPMTKTNDDPKMSDALKKIIMTERAESGIR